MIHYFFTNSIKYNDDLLKKIYFQARQSGSTDDIIMILIK